MKKLDFKIDEDNEIGLTEEDVAKGQDLLRIRLVETEDHVGIVVALSSEVYDLPITLKLNFLEVFRNVADQIVNEPDETRQ